MNRYPQQICQVTQLNSSAKWVLRTFMIVQWKLHELGEGRVILFDCVGNAWPVSIGVFLAMFVKGRIRTHSRRGHKLRGIGVHWDICVWTICLDWIPERKEEGIINIDWKKQPCVVCAFTTSMTGLFDSPFTFLDEYVRLRKEYFTGLLSELIVNGLCLVRHAKFIDVILQFHDTIRGWMVCPSGWDLQFRTPSSSRGIRLD